MPKITDPQPQAVIADLAGLRKVLDDYTPDLKSPGIPPKKLDDNLLIATWNIRAFGNLTEKWVSGGDDSPKRDLHSLLCIAEIVSRFDVIAIQEVRGNIKALRHMLKVLGPHWGLILTDVTKGDEGNNERMAFVFDMRKVTLSGLACEIVVPLEQLDEIGENTLDKQFARTPYAVSFRSSGKTFILVTLHVLYGDDAAGRIPELKAIARWLADWARDINAWDHNLIALGDFNIDRKDDALYQAFTSTGLFVPEALDKVPRTLFSDPDKPDLEKFYDQIAWFTGEGGVPALSLKYVGGGGFDFTEAALKARNLSKNDLSWRISDHYPLWVEFSVRD